MDGPLPAGFKVVDPLDELPPQAVSIEEVPTVAPPIPRPFRKLRRVRPGFLGALVRLRLGADMQSILQDRRLSVRNEVWNLQLIEHAKTKAIPTARRWPATVAGEVHAFAVRAKGDACYFGLVLSHNL